MVTPHSCYVLQVRAELQGSSPITALLLWKTEASGALQPGILRLLPRQFHDGSGIVEHYAARAHAHPLFTQGDAHKAYSIKTLLCRQLSHLSLSFIHV